MKQELIEYGLSEKEAKLYLLCLKLGETTANRLIELSGFARGTAYDVLERLKSRGLLSSFIKGKVTYFRANDPDVLVKSLEEKKTNIQRIVPELKKLHKSLGRKIIIEVFESMAGVKKILDDVLDNCKEVIVMGNERDARKQNRLPVSYQIERIESPGVP